MKPIPHNRTHGLDIFLGRTCCKIINEDGLIIFHFADGSAYKFYHPQDCCEDVHIEDIAGDLDDLIGSPFVMAEEVSKEECPEPNDYVEHATWTFYKFATTKGYVTIRWVGISDYYSVEVCFVRIENWKKTITLNERSNLEVSADEEENLGNHDNANAIRKFLSEFFLEEQNINN